MSLLVVLWLAARFCGLVINDTSSMPIGLYAKRAVNVDAIKSDDIISFCLAEPYKTVGLQNFYIEKGRVCSGAVRLIKSVLAIPGDTVELKDDFVKVNGRSYSFKTKYVDSYGRPLAVYPRGLYENIAGYFVVGSCSNNSWDSRYFGFIQKSQVLSILHPILTWEMIKANFSVAKRSFVLCH